MSRIAIYPGTFDPITNGHLDIIQKGLKIFDTVLVMVANNLAKAPLYNTQERVDMVRIATRTWDRVQVKTCADLSVDCARRFGAVAIIRGLRAVSDFENDLKLTLMNQNLAPEIETVFFMASERYTYLSSALVKEVARFGGDIRPFVPPIVAQRLQEKFQGKTSKSEDSL